MERYKCITGDDSLEEDDDGPYALYADAQATVEALQKKYDDLLGKYRQLVDFYDKHNGTPCEQIRHQQQVEALQAQLVTLKRHADLDCGDQSCLYALEHSGMRTNGGCRCSPKRMKEDLQQAQAALTPAGGGQNA